VADQANGRIQRFGDPALGVLDSASAESAGLRIASANPFRDAILLSYAVPRSSRVAATILDVSGRRVATLLDRIAEAGDLGVSWDARSDEGRRVTPGTYFVRFEHEDEVRVARVTVLK
jgi:hypothetical protein